MKPLRGPIAFFGAGLTLGLAALLFVPSVSRTTSAEQRVQQLAAGDQLEISCPTTLSGAIEGTRTLIDCVAAAEPTAIPEAGPQISSVNGVQPGQALSGTVAIEAIVTGEQINDVTFQIDGPQTATHSEHFAPYVLFGDNEGTPIGWDTTQYPDGDYVLAVTAVDAAGRSATVSINFTIANTQSTPDAAATNQWQTRQFDLTASNSYADAAAYTQVAVTATFNGPGVQQKVAGFWDGGKNWRVRFTPTVAGAWSYTIAASNGDAGLQRSGSFTVNASQARGFVRRNPANPQSFSFDNGEHYFMMGQTYYEIVRAARNDTSAKPAWQTAIDQSKAHGINKIRLLVQPWGGTADTSANFYPDAFPFVNNNHDVLDIAYWRSLDSVVQYIAAQGMVADVILFADSDNAFGSQAQDERFTRYVLARYAAYPSVIWCLVNEWEYTGKDATYWNRIGALIHNEDPWATNGAALRALSIHNGTSGAAGGKFSFFGTNWPSYAIIQWGVRNKRFTNGDQWGNYSILQNDQQGFPVVNDEYGYIGEKGYDQTKHRNALWGIALGGGYGSAGDARLFQDGPSGANGTPYRTATWHDAAEYGDIQRFVTFWTSGVPYWEMVEQNALVRYGTRIYVLGVPNREYVIYSAQGGLFKVAVPAGRTYRVTQYDPRTGATTDLGTVAGPSQWKLPEGQDWVLRVVAQ